MLHVLACKASASTKEAFTFGEAAQQFSALKLVITTDHNTHRTVATTSLADHALLSTGQVTLTKTLVMVMDQESLEDRVTAMVITVEAVVMVITVEAVEMVIMVEAVVTTAHRQFL